MNVLYDKDHYKLALGQINTARHLIDKWVLVANIHENKPILKSPNFQARGLTL